jgi:cytosine/adenosine deaminase-related metal-dependent hydrolase
MPQPTEPVDLLVRGAQLVATMDEDRKVKGGWVAIKDGLIAGLGPPGSEPPSQRTLDASGCLVTPGLVNTHHHIFQNLTRAYGPALHSRLFGWAKALYPRWAAIDEEAIYLSAFVGMAELALGGCTTTADHLYIHPHGTGDLLGAEIAAALELGFRFHPTRGSMSVSEDEGGLPPKNLCQDEDTILADSEAAVRKYHNPSPSAMIRVALAPCAVFSVSPRLMSETATLAERLDVRLHTHLAEDADEDTYCREKFGRRPVELFEDLGWMGPRSWVAHCVRPDAREIKRLGKAKVAVAHCPSSNLMLAAGLAPVRELQAAGSPVGLGCDGSASADSASLWLEARTAMLLARYRSGDASVTSLDALKMATVGGAACLGRQGELGVLRLGAAGDLVCWKLEGAAFAGALTDPVEALLRCAPLGAWHTVVAGRALVENGRFTHPDLPDRLVRHRAASARVQGIELPT